MEDKKINIVEQTKEKMFKIMKVPKECLGEGKNRIMIDENVKRSIQPFVEFPDGTKFPFGKYGEDGNFYINYDTTSRYGYGAKPIFGVYIDKYLYKIFIGECPHKDENGNWTTYEKVPTFCIGSFGGAYHLEDERDFPHIIDICSDEWRHDKEEYDENERKQNNSHIWELTQKVVYCSLGTYLKGLWNRIQKRFGKISRYKGKHSTLYTWSKYPKQLQFVNHWESRSLYFVRENEDWLWFTWFKKYGKWGFKREKRVNDHTGCAA